VANTVSANSGEVYIWTYEGRAIVAGGIGSFPAAGRWDFFHEFHVLTEHAPQPTKINSLPDLIWRPKGETPKLIPGAPAPANASSPSLAKSRRLAQMRRLAQEFSGTTVKPDDSGNARLRLLPTPIYRLDSAELAKGHHKIVDGAVFVFTGQDGTDAEMLSRSNVARRTAAWNGPTSLRHDVSGDVDGTQRRRGVAYPELPHRSTHAQLLHCNRRSHHVT
jgi:hypothetical protein